MAVAARRMGAKTRQRIQHYALTEPSFTIPFAAWELWDPETNTYMRGCEARDA